MRTLRSLDAWRAEAEIIIPFGSTDELEAVSRALYPEIGRYGSKRAIVHLEKSGQKLLLSFRAKDVVALRAAVNSYLRFIASSRRAMEALREVSK